MQIQVQCPACKASFAVPGELAGRDGECSRCLKIFKVVPLSGETPSASIPTSDSGATIEMPVYEEDSATPDTDEFDIPAVSSEQPSSELTSGKSDEPVLPEIEDDGSLFGDEIPELETVPEPISRYAAEDDVAPDTGSYSLSDTPRERSPSEKATGDRTGRKNESSQKAKRRTKSSEARHARKRQGHDSDRPDSDVAGVELFDDELQDDQTGTSPVMLKRSGTFSSSTGPAVDDSADSDEAATTSPMLKRRSRAVHKPTPASSSIGPKTAAGRERHRRTSGSPQTLVIAAGGAALLLIAGAYSWWSSGPSIVTPTLPGPSSVGSGPQSPVPGSQPGSQSTPSRSVESSSTAARTTTRPPRRKSTDDSIAGGNTSPLRESASLRTGDQDDGATSDVSQTVEVSLFPIDRVPIPKFPRLETPRASTIAGVLYHEISLGNPRSRSPSRIDSPGTQLIPGSQMDMILYLPSGSHQPGSLPCILIAAAGTTLLEGNGCFDESYQSETIPYVQQGFAVLGYSLDGPLPSDEPTNREVATAYRQFRAAHAGLVNSRNALEFVLQQVPIVDPQRIYSAGHSSAGTLSLLFAQHESRLAGTIAYAPCVDVESRLAEYVSDPRVELLLPEIAAFVRQESPLRHVESLKCPVFLFHAQGDSNSPFEESQRLAAMLAAQGTSCQLETISGGDHYESMLGEGIPRGIAWLKQQVVDPSGGPR